MKHIYLFLGLMLAFSGYSQELTLMLNNSEINGNLLTYDIRVDNFNEMVAMQYSIAYDESALEFVELVNVMELNGSQQQFNTAIAGTINSLWLDAGLTGATLSAGTMLYQVVFELVGSEPGDVCFSEDPLVIELIDVSAELNSFAIMDDCHSEPHIVSLTTSTQDILNEHGLSVYSVAANDQLHFELERDSELSFSIYNMSGQLLKSFASTYYPAGVNTLRLSSDQPSGIHLLVTVLEGRAVAVRFLR